MGLDQYVKQDFPVKCKGRGLDGKECLDEPVDVVVQVYKSPGSNQISSQVKCTYNVGSHGQRCKASHPKQDKVGEGASCPYAFDIPYALEKNKP